MDTHTHPDAGRNADATQPWAFLLHDLQQPLQAARLFADLLRGAQPPDRPDLVQALRGALTILESMVGGAVEAAACRPTSLAPVNLTSVLTGLAEQCAPVAAAHGRTLRIVASSVTVMSEPRRLERILRNLIINALIHARGGPVLVGARRQGDSLRVDVIDTGPGIPRDQLHALFQVGSRFGLASGTGLGLASAYWLSQSLGHRVQVSSDIGRGTRFSLEVRVAPSSL
ncbi:HAMP domain-containing sensor histidine kinase [Azospirillum sp.]|uniref:sensor histidine kinase n=1 Tax=Azospirillum sp. TaxID=34012 RepID=UPI002D7637C2|nr:HAMP domain-containing sensor histidine kinase [Azospirillum sp.]HYD64144.1 HAMP domain-containing sensor histidine kinase [Azospirillum sp.]